MLTVGNAAFPPHMSHVPLTGTPGVSLPMVGLPMLPLLNNVPSPAAETITSIRTAEQLSLAMPRVKNDSGSGSSNGFTADKSSGGSIRSTPSPDLSQNKLFVGGLGWQTSAEKLREYFSQYGVVVDVQILKDPLTQRSRGFGFITFSDPSSVDRVLQIPNHTVDGKKIDPKHATPKGKTKSSNTTTSRTKKVFVGGVSQDTSIEEIKAYFSHFGRVEEAVMLMDQQTKRHRGFGFVTFESEDVVDRVCDIHYHTIKAKKVECKKAQPKEAILQSTTAALAAAKRGALLGLPVGLAPVSPMPPLINHVAAQQYAAAAAAAQAQNAAAAATGYGKLLAGLPGLTNYRYSPYSVPGAAAAAAPTPGTGINPTVASQYQGYNLTNVDMSAFQGVDWNAIYGMGMYV